jgi:xanthine dehydrogenase accessory factor
MSNPVLAALMQAIEEREAVALLTVTEAKGEHAHALGRHALIRLDEDRPPLGTLELGDLEPVVLREARQALYARAHRHFHYETTQGEVRVFVEVQAQPPHLVIVGAGHIAVPLASIATTCDFQVTVLDDRPQYANTARFPTANQVIAGPFRPELRALREAGALDNHTYIVLVTRGHQYDVESLLEVLDDPLAYIGMIGSQRRIRAVFELLENEQGVPPEKFERVFGPIGLDIGARTPAEIAVCIMAEIINVLRGGPAVTMSEQIRQERSARLERLRNRAGQV